MERGQYTNHMPIEIEEFEKAEESSLRKTDPINEDELINFLAYNQMKAYTIREIESQTSMSILEIASRLFFLEEQGIVRNRGDYWAISKEYSVND